MARSFTDQEKKNIKERLIAECAISWAKFGYKKTAIDELCVKAGISKGAFYIFFDSKEDLFCTTLCQEQDRLYTRAEKILSDRPDKNGFAEALKVIYREYDKYSFIADTHSVDFVLFTNKLTEDQIKMITEYGRNGGREFLDNKPYLKFAIDKDEAVSVIFSLLSTISFKESLSTNHNKVFDFMVDNLIEKIFV